MHLSIGFALLLASATDGELPGEAQFNQCRKLAADHKVKLTLKPDTELQDLVGWVSTMTCKRFIVPQGLAAKKVTVTSPLPVSAAEAYRMFLSALNSIGLTVAPTGGALAVVATDRAKESTPLYGPHDTPPLDEHWVTQLVHVDHGSPGELAQVLDKLRSRDGQVWPYEPGGTLIITDTAANVRRMTEVVRALDLPACAQKVWMLKLRKVGAGDMADKLAQIFPTARAPAGAGAAAAGPGKPASAAGAGTPLDELAQSRIIPDPHMGMLIVVATERAFGRIAALVERLESSAAQAAAGGDSRVHVLPLAHASAEELAQTLGALTGAQVTQAAGAGGASRRAPSGRPGPGTGSTSPPPTAAPPPTTVSGPASPTALFEGEVRITADRALNALVVIASLKDFLALEDLVKKLDVARKQVFIEATILEVSMARSRDLGLWFHGGQLVDGALVFGGSGAGKTLAAGTSDGAQGLLSDLAQGLAAGVAGGPLPGAGDLLGMPGVSIPSFGVFLKALASSSGVNVLSTPHILTTDNEPAEILVGQNVPFQGAQPVPGTTPTGFGAFVPVQRQDVALDLKITPHISDGGTVRLEVDQEVSDILDKNFNGLGPETSKRAIKTVVVVKDEQPVVLGGLVRDQTTESEQKVPLLGDIPILGYFFKNTHKDVQKINLLVFLTPYVISEQSDLRRIFERKLEERRELLERWAAVHEPHDFDAKVDYRRKIGLLQAINRAAREADEEAARLEEVRTRELAEQQKPPPPVDLSPAAQPSAPAN